MGVNATEKILGYPTILVLNMLKMFTNLSMHVHSVSKLLIQMHTRENEIIYIVKPHVHLFQIHKTLRYDIQL